MEESSRDQGSELRFIWVSKLNKETKHNIRSRLFNKLIKDDNFKFFKGNIPLLSDIHIFIRNSDEFEERFWTQLENITTAFQYSFVITDNLGGKSYVEQKKHKEVSAHP